jgi:hypothetical protein
MVNQPIPQVTISLEEAVSYVTTQGYLVPVPLRAAVTSTNNIIAFEAIEAVSMARKIYMPYSID